MMEAAGLNAPLNSSAQAVESISGPAEVQA
jgi:hypothetical protein